MANNKLSKYLLYALGEITLVVIGILIALSLNNVNDLRKKAERERVLLQELVANLETNISNLEKDIASQVSSSADINELINHMLEKKPYNDRLSRLLYQANYAPDVVLTASGYETLKSSGLDLIHNDSLRREIVNLFEVAYPMLMQETRRLEDQLWPSVVTPLYLKHIRNRDGEWIPVNYEAWINDDEFINMISQRGEMRKSSTNHKQLAVTDTQKVIDLIEKELSGR